MAQKDKKKYGSWWEDSNYVEREKELQEQGKQAMERQEREAKRARNAAMVGDLANLFAQSAAYQGGGYKIDRMTPTAQVQQSKLQELRDRNAAAMLTYSQRMDKAEDADRKDRVAKGQYIEQQEREADKLAFDRAMEVAKATRDADQREFDNKIKREQLEEDKKYHLQQDSNFHARERRLAEGGNNNKRGNENSIKVGDVTFSAHEHGVTYMLNAYKAAVAAGMTPVQRYIKNEYGYLDKQGNLTNDPAEYVKEDIPLTDLTKEQIIGAIAEFNAKQKKTKKIIPGFERKKKKIEGIYDGD